MSDLSGVPDPIVVLEGLAKDFGDVRAVRGVDFAVRKGEMFGLIGRDGAGKTTTLRMIAGLLAPTKGRVTTCGYAPREQRPQLARRLGYLAQRFSLYGDLTVEENLDFFGEVQDVPNLAARRDEMLELVRLAPFRKRLADRLSGGMKQKLALACTLIHPPALIVLDEPTTGVDPVSRRDFWRLLAEIRGQGITILLSTPELCELWIIDHSTTTAEARGSSGGRWKKGGDLLYRWGNPRMYGLGAKEDQQLFYQHQPDWIRPGLPGAGHVTIFNNGSKRPGKEYSSIEALVLPFDPQRGFTRDAGQPCLPEKPAWSYSDPESFFSFFISGCHRLPNGNTLVCSGKQGRFFELTPHFVKGRARAIVGARLQQPIDSEPAEADRFHVKRGDGAAQRVSRFRQALRVCVFRQRLDERNQLVEGGQGVRRAFRHTGTKIA